MPKSKSTLHKPVHNQTALTALFVALAAFFFTFNTAVESERTAASVVDQVVVVAE